VIKNNDFDALVIDGIERSISHLKNLSVLIDVQFSNGDTRTIRIHMRPTNHLFSREETAADKANRPALASQGYLLTSYVHCEGNFQQLKGTSPAIKEHRIFCEMKWADSFYFPQFVELIQTVPIHVTVLANPGDEKTCLSGILDLADKPDDVYLVFFTLTKTNSREVNMLIESAYCVNKATHHKAQKLLTNGGDVKPFIVALKNVMEGRKPMEGLKQSNRAHKMKKIKRAKMQKAL
jgi:hypothetical protein